jgi:hypothetical protein
MSSRGWRWAVIGIALSAVGLAVSAGAAGAAEASFDATCADVYGKRAVGDLDKTTDPVPGSPVTSGQQVSVTLEWPTFAVAGERAHRVMECLSIDGGAPRLWADRRFTSASGTVSLSAALPSGLAPRSTVCSQSYLTTQGSFGPVTRRSEKTCYPVGKEGTFSALARSPSPSPPAAAPSPSPDSRSTPTTRAPLFSPPATSPPSSSSRTPDEYQPPWPPWEKTPKVSTSPPTSITTTVPQVAAPTRKSAGAQQAAPAPAPSSERAPASSTLPRTGAGVLVLLGIAAVALFSGRTLRRASYVIEDNLPVPAIPVDDDDPTLILGRRW